MHILKNHYEVTTSIIHKLRKTEWLVGWDFLGYDRFVIDRSKDDDGRSQFDRVPAFFSLPRHSNGIL
jgi:hypothetical protein